MQANLTLLGLVLSSFLIGCASQHTVPLTTVRTVNLARYAGHWYEIARLPNSFQHDDSRATADYTLKRDGTLRVVNTEFRPDGTTNKAIGSATVVPDSSGAKLRVKFAGLAALVPVAEEGNYWIFELAPDYSKVLVGTPDRKFLWLLARDAHLSAEERKAYLKIARREGFAVKTMIITQWPR